MTEYKSQWGQDKYLHEKFFSEKTDGFYIDVGANDGVEKSNSYFFEKLGWNGLLFEPIPETFKKLEASRKGIKINKAVYNKIDVVDFIVNTGYTEMLSGIEQTYDDRHLDRIKNEQKSHGGDSVKIKIETTTIQTELDKIGVKVVDFMSVDVEGSEFQVLEGIDFDKTKIKIIVIENNYKNTFEAIDKFLKSKGYIRHITLGGDEIYLLFN